MTGVFIALAAVALLVLLIWIHHRCNTVIPYLYFCRFPLVFGILEYIAARRASCPTRCRRGC